MDEDQSFKQSVTGWIADLKEGKQDSLEQIWDRYFRRLTTLARNRMGTFSRRVVDEEDIALNVIYSLSEGAPEGKFTELRNRDDLWRLLVAMTSRKVVDEIRRQSAQKRVTGGVRGVSILHKPGAGSPAGFDEFISADPTPDYLVSLDEENHRLFMLLEDDTQREVARYRMQGFSNQEISEKLGISLRSVERKLNMIRECWENEVEC